MEFIWTLIIGLVVGGLAKLIMPGKDPGGCIITILLGLAGSFIGGLISQFLFQQRPDGILGIILSVIGALILLGIYRAVVGRRPRP